MSPLTAVPDLPWRCFLLGLLPALAVAAEAGAAARGEPVAAPDSSPTTIAAVGAALTSLDDNNIDDHWHFTMHIREEGELRVVRSDPQLAPHERRQLVAIDGEPPQDKALAKFREAEIDRLDGLDSKTRGYAYLVDPGTLQLQSEVGAVSRFSFQPRIPSLGDTQEQLEGTLLFDAITGVIQLIEIRNAEPLAPAFSVTVDQYRLTFRFGAEEESRLLRRMESYAVGKAGFVKSFDSLVEIDFGGYRPMLERQAAGKSTAIIN